MIKVPVLAGPAFGATLNVTEPLPVPVAPLVIDSQSVLFDVAVHVHPPLAVTVTTPVPPLTSNAWLAGAIKNVHVAAS